MRRTNEGVHRNYRETGDATFQLGHGHSAAHSTHPNTYKTTIATVATLPDAATTTTSHTSVAKARMHAADEEQQKQPQSNSRNKNANHSKRSFTALQLEKLKTCEENSLQPMTIMCQNAIPTPSFPPPRGPPQIADTLQLSQRILLRNGDAKKTIPAKAKRHEGLGKHTLRAAHAPILPQPRLPLLGGATGTPIPVVPFKNPDELMFLVESRKPVDVLLGKSRRSKMHVGNVAFRALVDSRLEQYKGNTRRSARIAVCIAVTNAVYAAGGSFFTPQDKKCRTWKETDVDIARVKVGHAIRDNVKKLINGAKPKAAHEFSDTSTFTEIVDFFLQVMHEEEQLFAVKAYPSVPAKAISKKVGDESAIPPSTATPLADHTPPLPDTFTNPLRKKMYSFTPADGTLPASLIRKSLPSPSKKA